MQVTLGERAYQELRTRLVRGDYPPGSQLVNRTVAAEIGMSMTPIREAIGRLASEGLIRNVPGAGAFVRTISRQELAQLYDLRAVLEPFAAAEAAAHITSHELDELQAICGDWKAIGRAMQAAKRTCATPGEMARWLDNERLFHELIFQASRNVWLSKIAADLQLLLFGFSPQRMTPEFLTVAHAQTTWRGHVQLVKALRARDGERVANLVRRHIRQGRKNVLEFLDRQRAVDAD